MTDYIYVLKQQTDEQIFFVRRSDSNYNCYSKKGELVGFLILENDVGYFYDPNSICEMSVPIEKLLGIIE